MAETTLRIEAPPSTEDVTITAASRDGGDPLAVIRSDWSPPGTRPLAPALAAWEFDNRIERSFELATIPGKLTVDTFVAADLELERQVWVAADETAVAMRHKLANRSAAAIQLDALEPLRCAGPASLLIVGQGAAAWEILVQKRFKNDGPTSFRPGIADADLEMAKKSVGPTGEVVEATEDNVTRVRADPFCVLRPRGQSRGEALMLGYLSQRGHLARLAMQFTEADAGDVSLDHLIAECEFDGVRVDPGEERAGQWLWIAAGETDELIADFADRVGIYHDVARPVERAPSVFCAFYVYGEFYTESWFDEDMEDLAARHVPFDIFLIDGGWERTRGDWEPKPEWWPSGMKAAAERIRALGYRPAIWTAPFVAGKESQLAKDHPDWLLELADGGHKEHTPVEWVLDTTLPAVAEFLEETYRKITFDWGYDFHKFDFMRGVFNDPRVRFRDPAATRLEAYQRGLEAIRRGAGPDAYITVCGGHYAGSYGLTQCQYATSDVKAMWEAVKPRLKQNLMRTWMSRLWHMDPGGLLVRRREEPLIEGPHGIYGLGKLTDDEARLAAVNQYLGGGMVCIAEKFRDIDADRRALLRHVIPTIDIPSTPLDPFEPVAPSQLVTRVRPRCGQLEPWNTLAVINWHDEPQSMEAVLEGAVTDGIAADRYLVSDFFSQEVLGIFGPAERLDLGALNPHSCRLLRLAPWNGRTPALGGTDLHFSGGGVEVVEWSAEPGAVSGRLETGWDYPVRVTAAFPADDGCVVGTTVVPVGGTEFSIPRPA